MGVKRNTGLLVALVAAGALAAAGCGAQERADSKHPDSYSAEPIEGWVVDANTNEPLEGVVVVAAWILDGWTTPFIKFDQVGTLELMESVTDANGRFSFSGWGPLKRPQGAVLWAQDPELLFFKSGYDIEILSNPLTKKLSAKSIRTSQWNGKIIRLRTFTGSIQQYASRVRTFGRSIDHAFQDCSWRKIPNTIIVMAREDTELQRQGTSGLNVKQMLPKRNQEDPCDARNFWKLIDQQ